MDFNNENAILDFLSTDILTMAQREKENQSRKAKIGHKNIVELRYRQQKDLFKEKWKLKEDKVGDNIFYNNNNFNYITLFYFCLFWHLPYHKIFNIGK